MKEYEMPEGMEVPDVLILANGDFPSHPLVRRWLTACPYVVCCDGAADACIRWGRVPEAIVGDGDSLSFEVKERYADRIHREEEQETNDLSKAFRYCLSLGKKRVAIVGATGKREDHTLGNISLLVDYMEQAEVSLLTDYGIFVPIQADAVFRSYCGQHVSVFNFTATELQGEGLVYPLSAFTRWWQGTLNEANSHTFTIRTNGKVLVYRTYGQDQV